MKNRDQKNILKFWEAMLFRYSIRSVTVWFRIYRSNSYLLITSEVGWTGKSKKRHQSVQNHNMTR
jgi:hypothetical protein